VTGSRVVVVVEVIVPDKFFSRCDVTDGEEPDAPLDLVDFAVGIAGVIQIGAESVAVNHGLAVVQSIKISTRDAVVAAVGFFRGDSLAGILDHAGSLTNRLRGVYADGMNGRGADG
jgi:hypothetical protein